MLGQSPWIWPNLLMLGQSSWIRPYLLTLGQSLWRRARICLRWTEIPGDGLYLGTTVAESSFPGSSPAGSLADLAGDTAAADRVPRRQSRSLALPILLDSPLMRLHSPLRTPGWYIMS